MANYAPQETLSLEETVIVLHHMCSLGDLSWIGLVNSLLFFTSCNLEMYFSELKFKFGKSPGGNNL